MSEFNDVFPAVLGLHSFYFLYGGNRYCWWFRNPAITTCDVSKGYILHVNWCRISSNSMSFLQLISIEDVKRLKSHSGFLRQQSWQISEDYAMWLPHLLAVTLPLLPIFLFIFALHLAKKTMVFRIERKLGWCNRSTGQPVETRNEELELNGDKRSFTAWWLVTFLHKPQLLWLSRWMMQRNFRSSFARAVDAPVARQICQLCYRVPPPQLRITKWHEMRRIESLPDGRGGKDFLCAGGCANLLGFALVTTSVFFLVLLGTSLEASGPYSLNSGRAGGKLQCIVSQTKALRGLESHDGRFLKIRERLKKGSRWVGWFLPVPGWDNRNMDHWCFWFLVYIYIYTHTSWYIMMMCGL